MISKVLVYCNGDPAAAIPALETEFDTHIDIDCEDREETRKLIAELFATLWDEDVRVVFEDEKIF